MQAAATVSASADSTSPALMPTGSNRKTWTYDEATDKADDMGMKVYGLASMLKLAAFAAEARKALVSLEAAFEHRPKVRDDLHNHAYLSDWQEMPDASADALQFIAQEMVAAMEQSVDLAYDLAVQLRERDMVHKPA